MSSLPPPPQLELDDVVEEILLRLPPKPSSLPRASAVCRRWFRVVSGSSFSGRFRIHHRAKLPLLGCFVADREFYFQPTMDPPDRVPRGHFASQPLSSYDFRSLGSRHGLFLLYHTEQYQLKVWDPVSGAEQTIAPPAAFGSSIHIDGALLRSATASQHFQVVFLSVENETVPERACVNCCVYSSETASWGDLISTPLPNAPNHLFMAKENVLVGDSLYCLLSGDPVRILHFNLDTKSLGVTVPPLEMNTYATQCPQYSLMESDDGDLGFLTISAFKAQVWSRKVDYHGDSCWELARTIDLGTILPPTQMPRPVVVGVAQKNNSIFVFMDPGVFMVNLQSMQCKKVSDDINMHGYHPFETVYTTGNTGFV
jgi:hypothetical protein